MLTSPWRRLRRNPVGTPSRRSASQTRLRLEPLEGRDVPSTVMYGGTVTSANQQYNHPNAAGTALSGQVVPFLAMAFRVSTADTYTLTNSSNTYTNGDTFFALYSTGFNPNNPMLNLVSANDDAAGMGTRSQITAPLTTGTTYFLVTSSAASGGTGDFINQFSSPGSGTYTLSTHLYAAVDTLTSSNVTATSAILGGTVEGDGGAAVTDRGVVFSLLSANGAPTIGGAGVTKVAGGSGLGIFTANVTGLTAGATYAYRAYATNAVGTFYTSPVQTFLADASPILGGIITANQNVADNATVQPFLTTTVTDPDSPPQLETVTVSYPAANGSFSTLGGFTGSAGSYSVTGTAPVVQAALRGLTFVPTAHQTTPGKAITTHFTIAVNDGYLSASDSQTAVVATAAAASGSATVGSIQLNDGNIQRSEVESLQVTFSGPVTFAGNNPAAAFQLTHLTDNKNVVLDATVAANGSGQTVVTLTFSGPETDAVSALNGGLSSLADGRYQLTVLSSAVTGGDGLPLAGGGPGGNWVSPADTVGGSGLHLYRLYGDADGNGVVDAIDLGQFRSTFNSNSMQGNYLWYLDADNGGAVDAVSLSQFRARYNSNVF
jgi:hypothetical protein